MMDRLAPYTREVRVKQNYLERPNGLRSAHRERNCPMDAPPVPQPLPRNLSPNPPSMRGQLESQERTGLNQLRFETGT